MVDDALPAGPSPEPWAVGALRAYLRGWHRHEVDRDGELGEEQTVVVGNHGFGGVVDLNVLAVVAALHGRSSRPVTALVHSLAWTLGAGPLVEAVGGRPASREAAQAAIADGHHLLVFPGGDLEAGRSWRDRDRVQFFGRTGYARLAVEHDLPVLPVVTAGAGESLLVLSNGRRIARAVRADRLLRIKALPVSLSVPWGVSVGAVGILPYLPLPTKLRTAVLAPLRAQPGEQPEELAGRTERAMQERLDRLVSGRVPLLG